MFNKLVEDTILEYLKSSKMKYLTIKDDAIYYDEYKNHIYKKASFPSSIQNLEDIEDTITNNSKFYVYKIKKVFIVKKNDNTNKIIYHLYNEKNKQVVSFPKDLKTQQYNLSYLDENLSILFSQTPHNTVKLNFELSNNKERASKEIFLTRKNISLIAEKIKQNIETTKELYFDINETEDISITNFIFIDWDAFDKPYYGTLVLDFDNKLFEFYFVKEEYNKILKILNEFI